MCWITAPWNFKQLVWELARRNPHWTSSRWESQVVIVDRFSRDVPGGVQVFCVHMHQDQLEILSRSQFGSRFFDATLTWNTTRLPSMASGVSVNMVAALDSTKTSLATSELIERQSRPLPSTTPLQDLRLQKRFRADYSPCQHQAFVTPIMLAQSGPTLMGFSSAVWFVVRFVSCLCACV